MADYAKIELTLLVSENSDLTSPYIVANPKPGSSSLTPSEAALQKVSCGTGGDTVEVTEYGNPVYVVVENTDVSNYVEISYTSAEDDSNTNIIHLAEGKFCVLPDVISDLTITADTAAVVCKVWIIGA